MSLPIEGVLEKIREAARARRNIVVEASPGAGKTTRVPPALGEIVERVLVLEPRRLAARLAASRVAAERGLRLGDEVGYQIRFEDRTSERTRLTYLTEGVLTRRLMRDPELVGIDCVVLDEIHERHLHGDLALALLARLRARRPELFVVAMSATLDAAPIAALLDAVTIRCEGRVFEVDVEERAIGRDELDVAVAKAARALARDREGHILAFLPGAAEIRRAAERCGALGRDEGLRVLPLHGSLSAREQDEAVAPSSQRKLVLATNVAESSITIEGVTGVIDSGLAKIARHRPNAALPELRLAPISQASARQRAGRAGRTAPGRCIRLYTDLSRRPAFDEPEITRSDLAELRLVLALSGIEDPLELAWLTPPPPAALAASEALLTAVGALEGNVPTPIGRALARLPLPPRLGRVLFEARRRGVGERAATLLALLGESRNTTDLWRALDRFERGADASRSVERARRQILRAAERLPRAAQGSWEHDLGTADQALEAALASGFPDRVARRLEGSEERGAMKLALSEGGVALLADREAVGPEGLTLVIEARHTDPGRPARVELAAAIHLDTLLDQGADRIILEEELIFDEARGRVESVGRMRHGRIVLEESRARAAPSRASARLLVEAARRRGLFERDDLTRLRARLRFAQQGDASLPSLDDEVLAGVLERVAATTSRLSDIEAMPLATLVAAEMGLDERALSKLAPTRVRLAGGAELAVHYPAHAPPYVESYLQDFFGMQEGPRAGATPLVLELWAPNRRPVQVTQDLASFWRTHYPELRRQLARRYPKHHWPDDPTRAPAKRFVRAR